MMDAASSMKLRYTEQTRPPFFPEDLLIFFLASSLLLFFFLGDGRVRGHTWIICSITSTRRSIFSYFRFGRDWNIIRSGRCELWETKRRVDERSVVLNWCLEKIRWPSTTTIIWSVELDSQLNSSPVYRPKLPLYLREMLTKWLLLLLLFTSSSLPPSSMLSSYSSLVVSQAFFGQFVNV